MTCEYCHGEIKHNPRCPLYVPERVTHYCSICGEGIYEGEEYIENDDGECRHYDCFSGMRDLLEWLGYELRTMENDE